MQRAHHPLSARTRILGAILVVAVVGLAIVGGVTFIVQRERVIAGVDQRLDTQVAALQTVAGTAGSSQADGGSNAAATVTEELDPAEFTSVASYLKAAVARLVPAQNEAAVAIIDGRAVYRPSTLSGFDISRQNALITRAWNEAEKAKGRNGVVGTADTPLGALRYIAVPITMPGDGAHGVYLRAVNLDAELRPVTASMLTYALAALVMIAAIGGVGWFVAGRLLSPIRHLRDTADAITLSDFGQRLPADGDDDISDLTRTVNSMLDRLEGSVDVQRQLLDDVRHELKTPITIVRGHLELMDATDPADVASTRALGIAELDRMTRLVQDIDLLATVEGGEQFDMRDVSVADLTRRLGELVAVIPGHTWEIEATADVRISADPDRLLQAWLQLADNAAKYTPEGSTVHVGSVATVDEVRLWVRDHGPGIPAAARHRIFRRFDRAGGKRSVGGSGLGLAIVEAIVKSHGGTCEVGDTRGGGATFTIHVPVRTGAALLPNPVRAGDVLLQREAAE